jgi:TRAP-type C4-dicarboxylate transport system permease large subunit
VGAALVIGLFIYRELTARDLAAIFKESVARTAMVMMIVAGSRCSAGP